MHILIIIISLAACTGSMLPVSPASLLAVKPPSPTSPSPRAGPLAPTMLSPSPSPFPQTAGMVVTIHNETDLAQAITAATGSSTTTFLMPASLYLSKALPDVSGNLQLINAHGTALIACSASGFLAIRVLAASFGMSGITWTGCTNILDISSASQVTIDGCSFVNGGSGLAQVRLSLC